MHPRRTRKMDSVIEHLGAFSFELSERGRVAVRREATPVYLEQGREVLSEGDPCETILFVERGEVRVFASSSAGREISLYRLKSGDACVLTMSCALASRLYPATARVVQPTVGLALPASLFRTLFSTELALQQFVAERFFSCLTDTITLVTQVTFEPVSSRLSRFLLRQASCEEPTIDLTHAAIASELGTVREVVTRTLEFYASRGWVSIGRGRVRVEDPGALRALLRVDAGDS